jgi:hypothetical protein
MPDEQPPPRRAQFRTDSPARQQAREEADRLMDDQPPALVEWARAQGVSLSNRDSGIWSHTERKLNHLGESVLATANIWRFEQVKSLIESGVTNRKGTARELCMRVIWERMLKSKDVLTRVVKQVNNEELESLPEDIRWVARHPLLVPDTSNDPVLRSLGVHYERECVAPSQVAVNILRGCQDDKKNRDKLIDRLTAALLGVKGNVIGRPASPEEWDGSVVEKTAAEQETFDLFEELVKEGGESDE